jgi:hypothetical protein
MEIKEHTEEFTHTFEIIDIEANLVDKAIPLGKADELPISEIREDYFTSHTIFPEMIILRRGDDTGIISGNGIIRVIVRNKLPEEALKIFNKLINITKKLREFDESTQIFDFDITLILYFESKYGAKSTIIGFFGKDKLDLLEKIINEKITALYFGIYLRDFGSREEKDLIDIDIEPASRDVEKLYWLRVRRSVKHTAGIDNLKNYIYEMEKKACAIVSNLEVMTSD